MANSGKQLNELRWIEESPQQPIERPSYDEFELVGEKNVKDTIMKKCKENIFVPLGLVATVTCLTMGLINLRRGDPKKQQFFMRGRIGFQAFTLAAMTIGTILTAGSRRKNTSNIAPK